MKTRLLVYGVLGYTGSLFLKHALDPRLPIVLGAREPELAKTANALGLDHRVFGIDGSAPIAPHLSDVRAVVNLASIGHDANRWLIEACLQTQTHYVDLAAEYPDMIELFRLHETALARGVMLMPAAGFNLVGTDIAGLIASRLLPDARRLSLGFATFGSASRGTIRSVLRLANTPGCSRVAGELVAERPASKFRTFHAEGADYRLIANPVMGDAITGFIGTNIPDITAYSRYPWILVQFMKGRLSGLRTLLLRHAHRLFPLGPSADELLRQHTYSWAHVENDRAEGLTVLIRGPHAYLFTVRAIGRILERVARGEVRPGFAPPSFYGPELIEGIDGVRIGVMHDPVSPGSRTASSR